MRYECENKKLAKGKAKRIKSLKRTMLVAIIENRQKYR